MNENKYLDDALIPTGFAERDDEELVELTPEYFAKVNEQKMAETKKKMEAARDAIFEKKAEEESVEAGIKRLIEGRMLPPTALEKYRQQVAAQKKAQEPAPVQHFKMQETPAVTFEYIQGLKKEYELGSYDPERTIERKPEPQPEPVPEPVAPAEPEAVYSESAPLEDVEAYNVASPLSVELDRDTYIDEDSLPNYEDDWLSSYDGGETVKSDVEVAEERVNLFANMDPINITRDESIFKGYFRDMPVLTKVEHKKLKEITDVGEFQRFINKKKQQYRSKMAVPLTNSGVELEFVGASPYDYIEVYSRDPEQTTLDDIVARMKVLTNNIIACEPKVAPSDLVNKISYADYEMANFGFLAATAPELEIPVDCPSCKASIMAKVNTYDLILNDKEIKEAWDARLSKPITERASIKTITIELYDGYISIQMRVPSFHDVRKRYKIITDGIKAKTIGEDANNLAGTVINIDHIILDDSKFENPIMIYKFITTLNQEAIAHINECSMELLKDLVRPNFGFKMTCPKCASENTIEYPSIESLVFFHLLVSNLRIQYQLQNTMNG